MRLLLSPRWLGRHLLVLAGVAVFLRLGWWQWQRTESSTGTLQNFGYALEWPLFAAVVLVAWWRLMRSDLHPAEPEDDEAPLVPAADRASKDGRAVPAEVADPGPDSEDEGDEELVAYNRYLAWLRAQDEKQLQ